MTSLKIDREQVSYDPATDTLYVRYGDYDDAYTEVIDIPPNISVMYRYPDGGFAGIEIFDFTEAFGELPTVLRLDVKSPIVLELPCLSLGK
jgi:uncharacterized protein YuzE